jgi:biopolymer transport protein TolR
VSRPRRSALVRPAGAAKSAINVTPLVDVVLVLLIIFMVVMPLAEKDLAVRIPATEQVQTTTEVPPDQIVVKIERSGQFEINGEATPDERYVDAIKQRLDRRPENDRVVFVTSDDDAPYKKLVLALEGARAGGASTLAMVTEPPPPVVTPAPVAPTAPPPGRSAVERPREKIE